ncbi:MAG: hypothetical protein NZL96_02190 [Patescibacteria group bacterium]|nr:hypothetical protein [Patescibacteria group bacterium]
MLQDALNLASTNRQLLENYLGQGVMRTFVEIRVKGVGKVLLEKAPGLIHLAGIPFIAILILIFGPGILKRLRESLVKYEKAKLKSLNKKIYLNKKT